MRVYLLFNSAVGALIAAGLATTAVAQDAAPTAPNPIVQTTTAGVQPGPSTGNGLEDIVVTAQRRSENSQRTAVPLDLVTSRELTNAGVVTTTTLNTTVPSLYVSKGGGVNTSYFIRGVGNFANNGYSDPAIAFNVDNVYYGRPGSTVTAFYDLERIEVLKGPQGTLYGRNATAGAINVIPAKPILNELSGYATAGYGNYNSLDLEGAVNLPLGAQTALRVSGKVVRDQGFNHDGTSDEIDQAVRAQLLHNFSSDLSIRLSGDYAHNGGKGVGGTYTGTIRTTPLSPATATSPANYTIVPTNFDPRSGLLSPEGQAFFANTVIGGANINPAPLIQPYQNNRFYGASAEITWNTQAGVLTLIPAFRDSKINLIYNGPSFRAGLVGEHDLQFTGEIRFAGKRIGPVDYLLGGYYYDEAIDGNYTFNQYFVQSYQAFHLHTQSYAGFGRLTLNATDKFRLVGGGRYTSDRKQFDGTGLNLIELCTRPAPPAGPGCFGGPSVPLATSLADLSRTIAVPAAPGPANSVAFGTFGNRLFYTPINIDRVLLRNKFTYRLAAEYDVAPRSLLYLSYETGFRSGGFNTSLGHETYEPEFIKALTLGMKNRLFDNKLQLNFEAFRWDYTNQQVSHFGLDSTGGNSYFAENIGKSRIQGIDVDAQFRATPSTRLRASVQYLDNKLTSFTYNTIRNTTSNALPPIVGCQATPGTAPVPGSTTGATATVFIVDCSGQPGFNSPKWAINGGVEQTLTLGDYRLIFNVDGRYRSNRVTSFEYLAVQNSGSDFILDLGARFTPASEQWSVMAYVNNATDRLVQTLSQFAGTTGNVIVTNYAPPRTYGVRASIKF